MHIVFDFPPADVDSWATYNVTFLPNTTDVQKEQEKTRMLIVITAQLPPDPDNNILQGDLRQLDEDHSQLDVNFLSPTGAKVTRGSVRPPAVAKPPASRVVIADLAERPS